MANYSTNEFKSGLKILIDGDPYAIVENEMVKPGKGQAFNRVRVRNLKAGRTIERTWKSGDTWGGMAANMVNLAPFANMPDDVKKLGEDTAAAIKARG